MAELYLTTEQVADRLQLNVETIRRHIQSGRLRAIRRGRVYRIPESALNESSPERTETPASQAKTIMRDLQSRDGRTRNAAIIALNHAAPEVCAIVDAATAKAAEAYYSTPEGQTELSDWIALQSEPFDFPHEQDHEERAA